MRTRFEPSGPLRGAIRPPADKSITHRALLLAAMASGRSQIADWLDAGDTRSTLAAIETLGAGIEHGSTTNSLAIEGIGLEGPDHSSGTIDCGNAGTLIRLLSGWIACCPGASYRFDGDRSLRARPMGRIADPLRAMGAEIELADEERPPLEIAGTALTGHSHELAVASAQVKSCLLLAGLRAEGRTSVREPAASRDHTERMLAAAGADVRVDEGGVVSVGPAERLEPFELDVPGDISSAAFLIAAATIIPGSELRIEGVGLNPTRTGFLDALGRMGAELEIEPGPEQAGEPAGTIVARHALLSGTRIEGGEIPRAIDELPLLALAGCFADGETVIADAAELRHKESDRIETVAAALRAIGAEVEVRPDGMTISGGRPLTSGTITAAGDHRLAMLGAIAGLAIPGGAEVDGAEAAAISYPGFAEQLGRLAGRS